MRTQDELGGAPRVLPDAVGGRPPVEIDGRRYLDGGMASPIPVAEALAAGATHVLALQTRPFGVPAQERVARRRLVHRAASARLNPALVAVYRRRIAVRGARGRHRAALRARGDGAAVHPRHPPSGRYAVRRPARAAPGGARPAAADAERLVEAALGAAPACSPARPGSVARGSPRALAEAPLDVLLRRLRQLLLALLKRPWRFVPGGSSRRCRARSSARAPPRACRGAGRSLLEALVGLLGLAGCSFWSFSAAASAVVFVVWAFHAISWRRSRTGYRRRRIRRDEPLGARPLDRPPERVLHRRVARPSSRVAASRRRVAVQQRADHLAAERRLAPGARTGLAARARGARGRRRQEARPRRTPADIARRGRAPRPTSASRPQIT